ncbi:hypothetical protein FEM48_Zijuj07G0035500 [Ziziphus jujuba var. spinosa]|uniref:Voltage-gated hydrogen channel 1 n=1 Tax=Ziziphus jujuba var. spinosa TaxID=714518 RepID=A0A978V277_ZIZJJ|nr:hypothetical protein FEM48_Zijuj07G0035500 [Ziziphus jujuba var. spinosa]
MNKNNLQIVTNGSSRIQTTKPPTNPSSSPTSINIIESQLEYSIQTLIKNWCRRQKWHKFLNPKKQNHVINNNKSPWRTHLSNFLESTPVRVTVMFLLLLDLIFTTLELSSSLLSCKPNNITKTDKQTWFHWVGISILAIVFSRTAGLALGLGSEFLRRPGYVVDGVVLIGALVLEAFMEKKGGGFLVVVSLWRVVRVIETAFELSDEAIEAQIEGIICQFETLREENRRLTETIAEKDIIISDLKDDLDKCRSQACHCSTSS